jgi:flagellar motor switch protein FliN/FliY
MSGENSRLESVEGIGILMDVPVQLSVALGSTTMSIAGLLKLGTGSIVELDRNVARPVDLLVNHRAIARGEIVAIGENFGLRITELLGL